MLKDSLSHVKTKDAVCATALNMSCVKEGKKASGLLA